MNRRDLLLQEMGISQWTLYRPEVLQGSVGISVAENIRFITVSDENISSSPLLADVLLSLDLKKENCLCLNYDQIQHMECKQPIRYWLLSENSDQIDRTLAFVCRQSRFIARQVGSNFNLIIKPNERYGNKFSSLNYVYYFSN